MKTTRFFFLLATLFFAANVMAQSSLTEDGKKAQRAIIEYLRANDRSATIDTRDNSVNFRFKDVLYWITFEGSSPVLYTVHRNGLNFESDSLFKFRFAVNAANEVNRKSNIKCFYENKRVKFVLQTYAKEPSDFYGGLKKMVRAFEDVDKMFKESYEKSYSKWRKDSIERAKKDSIENAPTVIKQTGSSKLKVANVSFANYSGVDDKATVLSDYNQPLRKISCKFIKTRLDVTCPDKGIFKLGLRIMDPSGKPMLPTRSVEYSVTVNLEISKANKAHMIEFDGFGSEKGGFWKAGEYKVEVYDFEKGALLYTTSFNIL